MQSTPDQKMDYQAAVGYLEALSQCRSIYELSMVVRPARMLKTLRCAA